MKLTQNQISEFITELTATSQGIQELFSVILNALMGLLHSKPFIYQ